MRGWLGFSLVLLVVNGGGAWLVSLLMKDPLVARAVWTSAAAAAGVQLAGFGCARLMMGRKMGLFAAWGAAMGIRFLSLVIYALLVFKVLAGALVPAPALVSFAALLLLTSIVEPLFLNA